MLALKHGPSGGAEEGGKGWRDSLLSRYRCELMDALIVDGQETVAVKKTDRVRMRALLSLDGALGGFFRVKNVRGGAVLTRTRERVV